jgi:hypothetical protein
MGCEKGRGMKKNNKKGKKVKKAKRKIISISYLFI